jgi:hypothetical protein
MGVDAKVNLDPRTEVRKVSEVLGKILGCESSIQPLPGGGGEYHIYVDVQGAKVRPSNEVTCCYIDVDNGRGYAHSFLYHFEGYDGGRLIMGGSTATNIAIFRRLADFFGGTVDYNDCDSKKVNYRCQPLPFAFADDDEDWAKLQREINGVQPLTLHEVKKFDRYAGYPWDRDEEETLKRISGEA